MIELTVTDLRHRLLDVIRQVESGGEEVSVIRHGRRVARIVPERFPPAAIFGVDEGRVFFDEDDDLLETGEVWEAAQ